MKDFSSPQVVCRPALPSDRADVLEFTKLIWEGHDYIRFVWDDWLADPRGLPAVAEYAGHAVALGKATHIAEHQWWLEGLRVDPKFQGRKISSHMFEYLDDWWQQHGVGECRLMTSSERVQVHHLCARLGWEKIGEVRAYKASPLATRAGEGHRFRGVDSAEIADAVEFASINLDYCAGLVDLGWQFAVPDQAILEEEREEGRLWWWEGGGLLAHWEENDDGERTMGIAYAACEPEQVGGMLLDARRLAGELDYASVLWHAPVREDVLNAAEAAGFESEFPGSAYLFGKSREA